MKSDSAASRFLPVAAVLIFCALSSTHAVGAEAPIDRTAFRVCADPYSLPSSNKDRQGFENKIAQLFAEELKLPLEYTWFPQRLGFIRNTLRRNDSASGQYKCDIVMGVPANFELAATTKPYYRSTWTMVYVKGRGRDDVKSQDDLVRLPAERKKSLRIGLFDRSPAALWLIKNDMMENIVPYPIMSGDARAYPGEIIEKDLVSDKINLTFVWGPIAGYFAKQARSPEIVVIPMRSEPGIRFDFSIAMAVRFGEKEWKQQIQGLIDKHRDRIIAILKDYGVPLLDE